MTTAIYHRVHSHEGHDETAQKLWALVIEAQNSNPNVPRHLILEIDGHRNSKGGFDSEMLDLQNQFILEYLGRYLTEITMPLISIKNKRAQCNDIPPMLAIVDGGKEGPTLN
jgi:hypothetical protein